MSDASADEAANTPDVPGPLTNLQLQHQPIEEIHGEASFVDGGEDACAVAKGTGYQAGHGGGLLKSWVARLQKYLPSSITWIYFCLPHAMYNWD